MALAHANDPGNVEIAYFLTSLSKQVTKEYYDQAGRILQEQKSISRENTIDLINAIRSRNQHPTCPDERRDTVLKYMIQALNQLEYLEDTLPSDTAAHREFRREILDSYTQSMETLYDKDWVSPFEHLTRKKWAVNEFSADFQPSQSFFGSVEFAVWHRGMTSEMMWLVVDVVHRLLKDDTAVSCIAHRRVAAWR